MNIDDPLVTEKRVDLLNNKKYLRKIYIEWYQLIINEMPSISGPILEIGSGAGFFKTDNYLIKSDLIPINNVDLIFDAAQSIPLKSRSISTIVMFNVLHHISNVDNFFDEALRILAPYGRIIMIEPWNNPWSKLIYKTIHHELFDPGVHSWNFKSCGPLSDANGALPWIIFSRDISLFNKKYPELSVSKVKPLMPFSYIISGGFSAPALLHSYAYGLVRNIERYLKLDTCMGLFAQITIERRR